MSRLDSLTRAALMEAPLASVSVVVVHGQDTLLARAYGQAELNFGVLATSETRYRLIGSGTTLLAAAVLRAVEQRRLSLDDEAARYLPEFPWRGRRVSIRQLLDATSGLQDYHYLGDDYERVARTPLRTDEVTALFADRAFVHEPGAAYSWTNSGFHLAGIILERVMGEPYPVFLQREVLTPAGLTGIIYCDGVGVTPGLARGYSSMEGGFSTDVRPTVTAFRFTNSFCGRASDVAMIPAALRRLLRPETFQALITPDGAARRDSLDGFALGVDLWHEEGRPRFASGGTLLGYSDRWLWFPDEELSVAVLTNTHSSMARLGRNLARAALQLPPLAPPAPAAALKSLPVSAEERRHSLGQYRGRRLDPPSQFRALEFTFCVYEEAGRLMGQYAATQPFVLQKQDDSTFAGTVHPGTRFRFRNMNGRGVAVDIFVNGVRRERAIREKETCGSPAP